MPRNPRIRQSVAYGMGEVAQAADTAEQLMKDFKKYGLRHRIVRLSLAKLLKGDKDAIEVKTEIAYPKPRANK